LAGKLTAPSSFEIAAAARTSGNRHSQRLPRSKAISHTVGVRKVRLGCGNVAFGIVVLRYIHNREHPLEKDRARLLRQNIESRIDKRLY
jgi:hypothetical protein